MALAASGSYSYNLLYFAPHRRGVEAIPNSSLKLGPRQYLACSNMHLRGRPQPFPFAKKRGKGHFSDTKLKRDLYSTRLPGYEL